MAGIWSAIKGKMKSLRVKKKSEEKEEIEKEEKATEKEYVKETKEEQKYQRTVFIIIVISIIAALIIASIVLYYPKEEKVEIDIERPQAKTFYSFTCPGCVDYIDDVLIKKLTDAGIRNITKKDYINDDEGRKEMIELDKMFAVPSELQGHITAYLFTNSTHNATIIFKGHVPEHIISTLLEEDNQAIFDKIIVTQDVMDNPMNYKVWAFKGDIKEYPINTSIDVYLQWYQENKDALGGSEEESLLPLVLATGFLNGINPCAIVILLFFIAFLFTTRKTRANVFKMGIVYISAIFFVYFLIGLGLLNAILLSNEPHFMAKVGAVLVIILGGINLLNYAFPQIPSILKTPKFSWERLKKWIYKATLPSALVAGLLVGLCTFPCSGGIYVAVLGLLAAKTTYFGGLGYLYIYNFMFILPLIIILIGVSNKPVAKKLAKWERSKSQMMRLFSGVLMVALGVVILIWFV